MYPEGCVKRNPPSHCTTSESLFQVARCVRKRTLSCTKSTRPCNSRVPRLRATARLSACFMMSGELCAKTSAVASSNSIRNMMGKRFTCSPAAATGSRMLPSWRGRHRLLRAQGPSRQEAAREASSRVLLPASCLLPSCASPRPGICPSRSRVSSSCPCARRSRIPCPAARRHLRKPRARSCRF